MSLTRLPVLLEEDSTLDWTRARYTVKVDVQRAKAAITHHLEQRP